MGPVFSVKYHNPEYPDEIWAADWNWQREGAWGISRLFSGEVPWEIVKDELDEIAYRAVLGKFELLEWESEYPIRVVEEMSPAQLIALRRKKEKLYRLPHLDAITDNLEIVSGKGRIVHHAEEYN